MAQEPKAAQIRGLASTAITASAPATTTADDATTTPAAASPLPGAAQSLSAGNWYENAVCVLRKSGHKLTSQRRAILALFDCNTQHLTAQQVHESLVQVQPDISLVTVYRTLELLSDVGILSKINFNDGADRYERNLGDAGHHHHLICTGCGRVVEFGYCAISSLARELEEATGFTIDRHWLKLTGQCKHCNEINLAISPGDHEEE